MPQDRCSRRVSVLRFETAARITMRATPAGGACTSEFAEQCRVSRMRVFTTGAAEVLHTYTLLAGVGDSASRATASSATRAISSVDVAATDPLGRASLGSCSPAAMHCSDGKETRSVVCVLPTEAYTGFRCKHLTHAIVHVRRCYFLLLVRHVRHARACIGNKSPDPSACVPRARCRDVVEPCSLRGILLRFCARVLAQWRTASDVLLDAFQGARGSALRILGLLLAALDAEGITWEARGVLRRRRAGSDEPAQPYWHIIFYSNIAASALSLGVVLSGWVAIFRVRRMQRVPPVR